ncbi:prepilin-type N-terminal cleavage/methylation domain-containing protein [Ramlibacter sp. H39-3-26]|uniref:prepilin-type N-terminal cleavage/methylation domain-containing protein n=1 Tax=Curvibacter soli TaxID=3031331 RepID=UPI0023DC03FF|nr:prepilin-type N-terminal cleavage/methylation domain-containing protein [Ramlibacter sp. H39-3-26]MDF1486407.1 prepilin-type N-terminal cleavage/methylation domain-containing protein [Ramlibacter sp. H39-3-26]
MSAAAPKRRAGGFTLLEVLVVLTLMSLIMLAMNSALRTTGQVETRIDMRTSRIDQLRVAVGFLRSILERVSTRKFTAATRSGEAHFLFEGGANTLSWIGVMPARYGAGGMYFFHLGLEPMGSGDDGVALAIRYAPWRLDATAFPDWAGAERLSLAGGIESITIAYLDANEQPPAWQPAWQDPKHLPDAIMLRVQPVGANEWPAIIVPLRSVSPDGAGGEGTVVGGGVVRP